MADTQTDTELRRRLSSLYSNPDLLPQKLDLVTRRTLLLEIDRRGYHQSPFLDDRMIDAQTTGFWTDLDSRARTIRRALRDAIEVRREIPEAESLWIEGDSAQIQQVLINLVLNARDAIRDAGTITVALRAERAAGAEDDDRVVLQISDDGVGMSREFIKNRLFKPFDSTKGLTGMGIGAYECREFVHSLGGSVEVNSEVGGGSLFSILIPLADDDLGT